MDLSATRRRVTGALGRSEGAVLFALVLLVGCDSRAGTIGPETLPPLNAPGTLVTDPPLTTPPATTVPNTALDAGVPWQEYASDLPTRIAGLALEGDCEGLRDEFVEAYAPGNEALLVYIDKLMGVVGCLDGAG